MGDHMSESLGVSGGDESESMLRCSVDIVGTVRALVDEHGRLPMPIAEVANGADLFAAGLTSLGTVNLMLGIEEAFDIEFPDAALQRRTFSSIDALVAVVVALRSTQAV
jgi:acyl carrier protein